MTATPEARCIECGCTDSHACPGGCCWMAVDRRRAVGICSACETSVLIAERRLMNYTTED